MKTTFTILAFTLALGTAQLASAQDTTTGAHTWGVGASGLLQPASTFAGPGGAAYPLTAAQIVYDTGAWHAEGLIGMGSRDPITLIQAGGAFWYHLHQTAASDFSVGGGLALISVGSDQAMNAGDDTLFNITAGAQLRAFIVPNVALHTSGGLMVVTSSENNDAFALGSQLFGAFGLTYFFR